MPFDIGSMAMGAANNIIGTGMGLLLEKHNDRRQLRQQDKLNQQQEEMAKRMGDYNQRNQLAMWKATGPVGQMEQLKAAGLNPGLIYGMGGAGGQSTGSSNASVSGGGAPSGGGEIMGMTGNAMQMALLKAQKENIEADTQKKKADAALTSGAQTDNVQADTIWKGVKTELDQLQLELGTNSYKANLARIKYETDKALQELNILKNDAVISENTWQDKITQIGAEAVGVGIRNELMKTQGDKVRSDIEVNNATIQNWLVQQAQGWSRLNIEQQNTEINRLLMEFNTSLSREALGAVGGIISTILSRYGKFGKMGNTSHRLGQNSNGTP